MSGLGLLLRKLTPEVHFASGKVVTERASGLATPFTQNVHSHHFIVRVTQFSPELQVLLAPVGTGLGDPSILA
jgi:hypothetical protein